MRTRVFIVLMSVVAGLWPLHAEQDPMTAKAEAEEVMNAGISFVRKMLSKHGEFLPFAFAMSREGEVVAVATATAAEHPTSQQVIDALLAALRAGATSGAYRASALFLDARVRQPGQTEPIDAVQVGLEHASGYCVDVFFPYSIAAEGRVSFGDAFAFKRAGQVFEACK